ncbi:MAG: aspartate aminotransferase family protein [Rickettsiales bacterium]
MSAILPVYRRCDINIERGEGVYLFSTDGKRYLDFASGIAVNSLGHCHPHIVKALKNQADILWHCSNMYKNEQLEKFARRITEVCFADKVFFTNSGGEAVECGLKMLRKYHDCNGNPERFRVITMEGGFHGRSFACISAGGNRIARDGYAPLLDGFDRVEFNNLEAVETAITSETAAVLVEPIQGEGGVREANYEFLRGLRAIADKYGILLFLDEVQCGMGRTGSLFAYSQAGIIPDIVTVAKGIGGGFPLGACLTTDKVASCMNTGSHGSTYGSNPLAMAVGNAVLDIMLEGSFLKNVENIGNYLRNELLNLSEEYTAIEEVRGRGLMLGIRLRRDVPHLELVEKLRENGLFTSPAEGGMIRVIPPLIIEASHVDEAITILGKTLGESYG